MTLTATLNVILGWDDIVADTGGREIEDHSGLSYTSEFTNGTGLDQGDRLFYETRTLTNGVSQDYDVAGGLVDRRGVTITMARVKGIIVVNYAETAGFNLILGNHPTAALATWVNASNDAIKIGPGGLIANWNPSSAGWVVTAGTGDILRVTASGGTVTYDIAILGASA